MLNDISNSLVYFADNLVKNLVLILILRNIEEFQLDFIFFLNVIEKWAFLINFIIETLLTIFQI